MTRLVTILSLSVSLCLKGHPDVILVMTDDHGYRDLDCHENPILKTPALDQLHTESICFTNFHVSPFFAPTRAALLTGRYRITLRQWPVEADKPVAAERAKITISGLEKEKPVRSGTKGVVFEIKLPKGPTELRTFLYDKKDRAGGAYFNDVERIIGEISREQ